MHGSDTLLTDLALVFCVAAVVTLVFQRLRQPVVLGYLLVGLVLGPHTSIPVFADLHRVEILAQLGVILVIFSIGLEFSLGRMVRLLPTAGLAGAVQIAAMLWLGYTLGRIVGFDGTTSLFFGGGVCISSTMIIARALGGRDDIDARVVESVFGILIVQDLAAIVLIAVLSSIAGGAGLPPAAMLRLVGEIALFLGVAIVVGILVVPRLIREADRRGSDEVVLIAALGVCFGLALAAAGLDYSVALGAFLAGTLVAESGRRRRVEHLVAPVRDMFAAVFFVSIGMLVDPQALADHAGLIAATSALIVVGQIVFASAGSFLAGKSVRVALQTGMTLAQIGEFSFIIVGVGVSAGAVSPDLLAIAVGAGVVTTFTTPFLIAGSARVATRIEARLPHPVQTFASLYGAWFESLRRRARLGHAPARSPLVFLVVDILLLSAIVVGTALGRDAAAEAVGPRLGLSPSAASTAVVVAAFVVALPFAVGFARAVARLGAILARSALPGPSAGIDLADAPRRAFVVALELAIALVVMFPLVALIQPFLPLYAGAAALGVVLAILGVMLWRRASNLEGHVRAGAELVFEILREQRASDVPDERQLDELLPGLGAVTPVEVPAGSPVAGKTLADLDLRALTGATVIAIARAGGETVGVPSGGDVVGAGDVVTLAGKQTSIARAVRVLRGEPAEDPGVDAALLDAADERVAAGEEEE